MLNNGISMVFTNADRFMEGISMPIRLELMDSIDIIARAGSDWLNYAVIGDFQSASQSLVGAIINGDTINKSVNGIRIWNNLVDKQKSGTEATKHLYTTLLYILVLKSGLPISLKTKDLVDGT